VISVLGAEADCFLDGSCVSDSWCTTLHNFGIGHCSYELFVIFTFQCIENIPCVTGVAKAADRRQRFIAVKTLMVKRQEVIMED
jgi:hypothetical protein